MRRPGSGPAGPAGGPVARWRRRAAIALLAYGVTLVAFHLAMAGAVLATRVLGHDPRRDDLARVHNLREVDDRVLAGGQPDEAAVRQLAGLGVTLVVDLRTGASDDPHEHDQQVLDELGVQYLALPIGDGHAPSPETVERFVDAVDAADGKVFLHCGGGVGRSASMQAAYLAATGRDPSWAQLVALGPMTLEQLWFVGAVEPGRHAGNPVVSRASEVLDAPRRLWSRTRAWLF